MKHLSQRWASLKWQQGPFSHFLQPQSQEGMQRSWGMHPSRQNDGQMGRVIVYGHQDGVLPIPDFSPGFPGWVTLRDRFFFLPPFTSLPTMATSSRNDEWEKMWLK